MKLYDVPRNTPIIFTDDKGEKHKFFFHHIDGMYSLCKDEQGNTVHLAAWTEVEIEK